MDLTLPKSLNTNCNCSDFTDSEIPNLSQSIFDITFWDCEEGTEIGFGHSDYGEDYRRIMCKVYSEISQLITQASPQCSGDSPPKVNISVLASNSPEAGMLPPRAFAGGSPGYDYTGLGGILTGLVWDVINGGVDVYSTEDERIAHGIIVLNLDPYIPSPASPFVGYYTGESSDPLDIGNQHDLYTILFHEAIHTLGFTAGMTSNGYPSNERISYPLFTTSLFVDDSPDPLPIIQRDTANPFKWLMAVPSTSLYGSCFPTHDPDMFFINQNDSTYIIFTDTMHQEGSSFSHFAENCEGPHLMGPSTAPGQRKNISEKELAILCSLGYTIASDPDCGCNVVGVDDYGPACLDGDICTVEAFEFSLCDGNVFSFPISNLLNNDFNADGILHIRVNNGNISINNGLVEFEPCSAGNYQVIYEPYSNSCDQLGNATLAYFNVKACEVCDFSDEETLIDGGFNKTLVI